MQESRRIMGRSGRVSNETLFLRFLKFLVIKLPLKSVVFDISKGMIKTKQGRNDVTRDKRNRNFISVKDPFLKNENHGYFMQDENNFNRLISKMKHFIIEASQGRLEDFLTGAEFDAEDERDERDAALIQKGVVPV